MSRFVAARVQEKSLRLSLEGLKLLPEQSFTPHLRRLLLTTCDWGLQDFKTAGGPAKQSGCQLPFPCCEKGGPWTMQLLSGESCSSQSVTHYCPGIQNPVNGQGFQFCLLRLQFQPALLQGRDVSREGFSVLARAKLTL